MAETWLDAVTLASAVGVTRRMATKIMARAALQKPWKGCLLRVRLQQSRGGSAGTCYRTALSSLPEAYQSALRGLLEPLPLFAPVAPHFDGAANQDALQERRYLILREIMEHPAYSPERVVALDRAHALHKVPMRTLHRWIKTLDDSGGQWSALGRKRPTNAGKARAVITRAFDKAFIAAGHDPALLPELREQMIDYVTGAWASVAGRAGRNRVAMEAGTAFEMLCRERGFDLPVAAYKLPSNVVDPHREYRDVDIRANDRKAFDDAKPRSRIDSSAWGPMQRVCMDVKPLDILVARPDGSVACPRAVAFLDVGTRRMFVYLVLCEPNEGIRQEHVIEAFAAMVEHPEWGLPQTLQRDNGSEYLQFDKIKDALKLINDVGVNVLTNAKAYSGASKPIESHFANLDLYVTCQMDGYIGKDRLNKKIQTLGKPRAPYNGSFEQFNAEFQERLLDWMWQPVRSGPFKERAPLQVYSDYVNDGWAAARLDPASLDAAFSRRETRRVDRGAVSINGIRYLHPDLPNGQDVDLALPYRRGDLPLVKLPKLGWAALQREMLHKPWEHSGAIYPASRKRRTIAVSRR